MDLIKALKELLTQAEAGEQPAPVKVVEIEGKKYSLGENDTWVPYQEPTPDTPPQKETVAEPAASTTTPAAPAPVAPAVTEKAPEQPATVAVGATPVSADTTSITAESIEKMTPEQINANWERIAAQMTAERKVA